jgi:molybdopterin synthase sulfur carrier subunit
MLTINLHYFALLREKAGLEQETLLTDAQTYAELYEEVSKKHGFDLPLGMIQVAVDDEFSSMQTPLKQNAKVVFIPPVAGG